ncbi:ATP-binding protein [Polaromonas sp.]|jgi:signal transduction histidine kinase|uniref:sensor histidine kinase n=1 Tax=Polaromonas sp. TaxID=1869339 RepID=UPI002B6D4780|nr:ATP-binding protein [Polaromonas sp.]HQS31541.1 ATP-binding protein [Polaromonas sp.]HQS91745.1 ATP-binding protein [Polaromonas sp.]
MSAAAHQGLLIASALVGSLLALVALWGAWGAWLKHRNSIDLSLSVAALTWLMHLAVTNAVQISGTSVQSAYVTDAGFQVLMISISFFLLTSAGIEGRPVYIGLGTQAVLGGLALQWSHWGSTGQQLAHELWIMLNMLAALVAVASIARQVYRQRNYRGWLALAGGVLGIGISLDDIMLPVASGRLDSLLHHFYAAFLLVMWHLVTYRSESSEAIFAESSGFQPYTGFDRSQVDLTASAVAGERRRIAQDLHDGVASQLVSILSSLDDKAPQQQAVALALENCLLDLKMTVDAIDNGNDSVIEALGRLRYRVQHSLDKLGIRMAWKVDMCAELEALRGDKAQQVLRIAQECLANVMRHAHATQVEVVCRFLPESEQMLLEVRDNGAGIGRSPEGRPVGKGLASMRRRAKAAGGELIISSKVGTGTRVRFTLPLTSQRFALIRQAA